MKTDYLSRTFFALAHPARREMLARVGHGEVTVQELAKPFKMSAPAVSRHLKVLERAGLIRRSRDGQWRPCRLDAAPMKEATQWMDQYRAQWESQVDRLEAYLEELQREAPAAIPPATPSSEPTGE